MRLLKKISFSYNNVDILKKKVLLKKVLLQKLKFSYSFFLIYLKLGVFKFRVHILRYKRSSQHLVAKILGREN